jgi:type II secretory pathway component GspD/PulD (secretin)
MTAAFWQTVAVLFGSNLKQAYDPSSKDADIEKIVKDVARMYGYPS